MDFFIDGMFTSRENAKISVLDLGLLRGVAVFDFLRTYRGKPFHLREHLLRLRYSAENTGLSLPYSFEEIEAIVMRLLAGRTETESCIKMIVTGGESPDQLLPSEKSSFIAFVYPQTPYPATHFSRGISAVTTKNTRSLPSCKTMQYLAAILALREGKKQGASEALYLNANEEILEASTSNFFAFRKRVLLTPPEDEILVGITREVVLRICKESFPIEIRPIPKEEIAEFDEAFVTASNKEVMPLVRIDDRIIGNGSVGPLTRQVMDLFAEYTRIDTHTPLFIPRYEEISL